MTLDDLLKKGRLRRQTPSPADVENLLAIAAAEIKLAEAISFDPRGRFIHAYDAARSLADAATRAVGYRTRGAYHHVTIFEALPLAIPDLKDRAKYFDDCRDKRNTIVYKRPDPPTQAEADEALARAKDLDAYLRAWLMSKHPALMPPPPDRPPP